MYSSIVRKMRLDIVQRKDGILGEISGDFPMDEAVISGTCTSNWSNGKASNAHQTALVLPSASRVLQAESYGDTAWTQTGRIIVELPSGDIKQYFIKVIWKTVTCDKKHTFFWQFYQSGSIRRCWTATCPRRTHRHCSYLQPHPRISTQAVSVGRI